ncbi:MAG: tetratricopeptide repeat protein [Minwuia sp.]|nr:tetratricopeptide repeat protein [Minwuia sp.]
MRTSEALRTAVAALLCALFVGAMQTAASAEDTVADGLRAYHDGDVETARKIWESLAEGGDPKAQFNLGALYDAGDGVAADPARATALWTAAADQGLAIAAHNLALLELELAGNDPVRIDAARTRLEQAADAGLSRARYTLGKMMLDGVGGDADATRAIAHIRRAAEDGYARAEYNMGKAYRDGLGVAADPVQAVEWFDRAARHGHAGAQDHLARRLATGEGVAVDTVKALGFALLAARQDYPDALAMAEELKQEMGIMEVAEAVRFADTFNPAPTTHE